MANQAGNSSFRKLIQEKGYFHLNEFPRSLLIIHGHFSDTTKKVLQLQVRGEREKQEPDQGESEFQEYWKEAWVL